MILRVFLHTDRWFSANGRYSNSVIMSVVFGIRSKLDDLEVTKLFETAEMFLEQQQPGVNLVDGFPILAKLPRIFNGGGLRENACFITRPRKSTVSSCFLLAAAYIFPVSTGSNSTT